MIDKNTRLKLTMHDGNGYSGMSYKDSGLLCLECNTFGRGNTVIEIPLGAQGCLDVMWCIMHVETTQDISGNSYGDKVVLKKASPEVALPPCTALFDLGKGCECNIWVYKNDIDCLEIRIEYLNRNLGVSTSFIDFFDAPNIAPLRRFFYEASLLGAEGKKALNPLSTEAKIEALRRLRSR